MSIYIYGKKACEEALNKKEQILEVFLTKRVLKLYETKLVHLNYQVVDDKTLDHLSENHVHQGIVIKLKEYNFYPLEKMLKDLKDEETSIVLILDGILDPYNLGAIFRSAAAFDVKSIILRADRQAPITSVVYKVSAGAMEHLKICQVKNINQTIDILKEAGFWIYASSDHGAKSMYEIDYPKKVALIVGNEGKGIAHLTMQKADFSVKIPLNGPLPCLNVASATSVLLSYISHFLSH